MYDYKPVEIHAWKIGYGIGISLATFFIGIILAMQQQKQQESDAASENNNIDSFISDASENDFTNVKDATKTKTNETIQNTAFARFASKYLEKKDIENSHREASHIPIKENDSVFKTLKNVKHGF
uniref:Uncharacterized protein n=1 Tax=Panagrolaimus sp. ES5 TaxID=591445 RepID=A0AC34FIR2_9BILA